MDFKNRNALAWSAYWKLEKIWKARQIPIKLKANIFEATVVSELLYGSETCIVSSKMRSKLNSFATTCFRMWLGIKPLDKISSSEIYKKVGQTSIIYKLQLRQLRWVGHTLRKADVEPAKIFLFYEPEYDLGSLKLGRKPKSYFTYISELLFQKRAQVSKTEVELLSRDRKLC